MRRILVVDDDRDALISIANVIRAEFPLLEVRVAPSLAVAEAFTTKEDFDLVLASERLKDSLTGRVVPLRKPVDPEALLALLRGPSP